MVQNFIKILFKKFKEKKVFRLESSKEFFFPIKLVDTKVLVDMIQILLLNFCMESFIFTWFATAKNFHSDFFYWTEHGVN